MPASQQIVVLNVAGQLDGSFQVSGVFWLVTPTNNVVPNPLVRSLVANITVSDLSALRAGTTLEVPFNTTGFLSNAGSFPPGTTLATVQSALQAQYTVVQNQLNTTNTPLANLVETSYNGTSWAAYGGVASPTYLLGNLVNVSTTLDFRVAIALGLLPGVIVGHSTGYVLAATAANTFVRASTYVPQTSQGQRSLVSSSALDTSGGAGAQTITINYLNSSMQLKQDVVTLNGTTAVNTNATDIQFLESMVVATCGTDRVNQGVVTMMTGLAGAGTAMASINATEGSTFYAHHYVPAGVTCYVTKATGSGTLAVGKSYLTTYGDPRTTTTPILQAGDIIVHLAGATEDHGYDTPMPIVGPNYILAAEFPVTAVSGNDAYASFDWFQC
jgi:hypothetical protein